ncbi:MAG: FAD-dependent oxidoreductase [Saccharofermentans sp.]|nr:FAD-dependent oxidoreductase [Saccharofermentans sp.]
MEFNESVNDRSVCIIGSGMSGLVTGMRLAKAGFTVSVVEELASPGGLLAYTRIGREYLELVPHHIRKSDKALLSLAKEMGVEDKIKWYDTAWSGRASIRKVGYFDGGYSCLISSLMQYITDHGGHILFSTTVAEITSLRGGSLLPGYRTTCILTNSTRYVIDSKYVVFTGSCRTFLNVSHGLDIPMDYRDIMMNISYKAGISALMVLKKPSTEMYSRKAPEGMPFDRIIGHSAAFGERGYGGHVVYLTGTCSITDSLWIASDSDILNKYFSGFRKLYPSLRKSDIKSYRLTKTRYAFAEKYPEIDLTNPCKDLYVCASGLTASQGEGGLTIPKNRLDNVIRLAGRITSEIIRSDAEQDTVTRTDITDLAEYL